MEGVTLRLAKSAGFCFGVRRAVQTVYELLEKEPNTKIYTLGKLIHNRLLVEELEQKGVTVLEEETLSLAEGANAAQPAVIVVRAHGIPLPLQKRIEAMCCENPYLRMVDCTCPYVKNIHKTVAEHATPERHLIIIGDQKHPEVVGIRSYAAGEVTVCASCEELQRLDFCEKYIVMVAQTTQKLTEWRKCQKFLENYCTNRLIFDTICNVTENRQNETVRLAKEVDCMLVLGGRDSSNTKKLFEVARAVQPNTYFLESAADFPYAAVKPQMTVGMTAGASTPDGMIEEVKTIMKDAKNFTQEDQEFAQLLSESFKTIHTGEVVTGTIMSVAATGIYVDLGAKSTGFIPNAELPEDRGELTVGSEVTARVTKLNDQEGQTTLSKKAVDRDVHWQAIEAAKENDTTLTGKVTKVVKGGLLLNVNGSELFVPASQSGLAKDAELDALLGTEQNVKVIDIDPRKRRAVASIRAMQRAERKQKRAEFWENVTEGMQFTGTVKSLTSYGAFVDLGGLDGMIHVSELSWKRIKHPSEVLKVGDTVTVFVKSLDKDADRVSLGYKTEETNPWTVFMNTYKVEDVAHVKIVSLTPYGAFAEVVDGVDGLIHISQIANQKIAQPADVLKVGDEVDVKIIDIDEENRKISLSIRALLPVEEAAEEAPEEASAE